MTTETQSSTDSYASLGYISTYITLHAKDILEQLI
jgi:hypothetical protein